LRSLSPYALRSTLDFTYLTGFPTASSLLGKTSVKRYPPALKTLYQKAGMVHGDASEYNILIRLSSLTPCLIDFSQSVLTSHPNSGFYLRRDIRNLTNFFQKKGAPTRAETAVFNEIVRTTARVGAP